MDTKKRVLGPGAKCCGECDLCCDQAPPVEPVVPVNSGFDWGTPPPVDPDNFQEDLS